MRYGLAPMSAPPVSISIQSEGLAVERRGRSARIALAVFALATLAFSAAMWRFIVVVAPDADSLWALLGSLAIVVVSASAVLARRFDPTRSAPAGARSRGELLVGADGVSVTTGRVNRAYGAGFVADGWIDDAGEVVSVILRMRDGDVISLEMPTLAEARAVLLAAGVAAEQQVLRMRLANPMSQVPIGGCIAAFGGVVLSIVGMIAALVVAVAPATGGAWGPALAILTAVAVLFALLVRALIPRQIVIGTDGVVVPRAFGTTFVAHDQISEVISTVGAVVLRIRGEKPVRLPTGSRYGGRVPRAQESVHTALRNRLAEAQEAGRRGSSEGARLGDLALDRGGRSLAVWREHLRGLTSTASYRRPGVVNEEIASVLEDAGAPPHLRVAAAMALAPIGDAAIRLRIAGVVRTCADDHLRVALEAAVVDELTEDELAPLLRRAAQ